MSKVDFDAILGEVLRDHENNGFEFTKICMREACIQVLDEASGRFETNGNDPIYESVKDEILQIKEEL